RAGASCAGLRVFILFSIRILVDIRQRPMKTRALLALAAVGALSACGSTVQSTTALSAGSGLAAPADGGAGPGAQPAAPEAARVSGQLPNEGGAADGGSTVSEETPQRGGASGRKLPPIQIGTYYLSGGNEAVAAMGFGGLVIPDNKPLFDA